MENVDTSRRGFLKSAVAASGAIMPASPLPPSSPMKKNSTSSSSVPVSPAWPALSKPAAPVCAF